VLIPSLLACDSRAGEHGGEPLLEVPVGIFRAAGDPGHRHSGRDDHIGKLVQHIITGRAGPFPPVPAVHADHVGCGLTGLLGKLEHADLGRDIAVVGVQAAGVDVPGQAQQQDLPGPAEDDVDVDDAGVAVRHSGLRVRGRGGLPGSR
jgi:hypothetical protein